MSTPEREVIVFDGVCVLCSRLVRFILARDPLKRYRFAATQSASGRMLLRDHGLDPENSGTLLLFDGEGQWTESEAVLRIVSGFGGAWRLVVLIRILPRTARDMFYRAVARRRYRWFGKRETCLLPSPETADRFLR